MHAAKAVTTAIILASAAGLTVTGERPGAEGAAMRAEMSDEEQILGHIRGIFEAFLRRDREAIRKTHAADWVGFLGPSTKIERGIADYMRGADLSLKNLRGDGYEILDTEVQLHGDLALAYYVARYDYRDDAGTRRSMPLRSLDVYRRENGRWIQAGSHITPVRREGSWGEGPPSGGPVPRILADDERAELMSEREKVWRAWFGGVTKSLESMIPVELIAINPAEDVWAGKKETLAGSSEFVSSGSELVRLEFPRTRILAYGDVAILFTEYLFETRTDGKLSVTSGRGTELFVRREGRWLNSGWHLDSGR